MCVLQARWRGISAPDHRERRRGKELGIARHVQHGGRVRDFQELSWVSGIGESQHLVLGLICPVDRLLDFRAATPLEDARRERFRNDATQLRSRRVQYIGREPESRKQ